MGLPKLEADKLSTLIFVPFLFLPGWAYRLVLKSTFWFWWILFVVGGAPKIDAGIEGLRADAYCKAIAWVSIALAILGVGGFFFGEQLKAMVVNHRSEAPLLSSAALLFLVEWSRVPLFQWISVIASALTLFIVFWTQALVVDSKISGREQRVVAMLPRLGYLINWKSAFGALNVALLMLYIALYANSVYHWAPVSPWAAGKLRSLYGTNAEALLTLR